MSIIFTAIFLLLFGCITKTKQHDEYIDCTNIFMDKTVLLEYNYWPGWFVYPSGTSTRLHWLGTLTGFVMDPTYLWTLKDCGTDLVCIESNRGNGWKGLQLGDITYKPDMLMTTREQYKNGQLTFKIYCTSCTAHDSVYADCKIKNMYRETFWYTNKKGTSYLKKEEEGSPSWFKWRIMVEFHGRPTSYMKEININLTGKVLHKFSLSSGISCWQRCRDIINCDASHYQDKECTLYSEHDSHIGAGVAYFRAEAPNGYTVRFGDCPGNDLSHLYGNLVSLRECAKLCDDDKRCRGFMWYDRRECYPKSESCQSTRLDTARDVFYSKLTSDSCPPGSFKKSLDQNSGCELCPIGEYQDQQGLTGDIYKCKPCPSKSGGDFLGSTSCLLPIRMELKDLGHFIFTASLEIGTPGQTLPAMMDTGSGLLVVTACNLCKNSIWYKLKKSSTSKLISDKKKTQQYGSGSVDGKIYKDNLEVGATVRRQTMMVVKQDPKNLFSKFQAVVGLRFNFQKKQGSTGSLVQSLVEQDLLPENLFTIIYFPTKILTFGKINEEYVSKLTYVPLTDQGFNGWEIPVDSIGITDAKGYENTVSYGIHAKFDTGASFITGPSSIIETLLDVIPKNCNKFPSEFPTFYFKFSGNDFILTPVDYMHMDDLRKCRTVFKVVETVNLKILILGVPFMKTVFTVFHIEDKAIGVAKVIHSEFQDCTNKFKDKEFTLEYLYWPGCFVYPSGTSTSLHCLGSIKSSIMDSYWTLKDCGTDLVCIESNRGNGWKGLQLGDITYKPGMLMTTREKYKNGQLTFKIYCTSCTPHDSVFGHCKIKNMYRETFWYTNKKGTSYLKKEEEGYPSRFKWRIKVKENIL